MLVHLGTQHLLSKRLTLDSAEETAGGLGPPGGGWGMGQWRQQVPQPPEGVVGERRQQVSQPPGGSGMGVGQGALMAAKSTPQPWN